jgi:epoxyqueuosine reductase
VKNGGSERGQVSCYAWGDDYHEIITERLTAIVKFIEDQVGYPIANRYYTDTGPLLERDLAMRAGLGWIGKNTCLIHPQLGSYFFLCEILLGIELEIDPPFIDDRCGSCTRCLDACPTACILPDRTIDARRCISYLTIELKGPIPPTLRARVGDWVFGCDVCQQVCPWNQRFAQLNGDPAFSPRNEVPYPDLLQELTLTPESFNRKFKRSPLRRAKRRGYLRNVAVALGNCVSQDVEHAAVTALTMSLQADPESLVRGHAAWALGHIKSDVALQALEAAFGQESDAWVRDEIRQALSEGFDVHIR